MFRLGLRDSHSPFKTGRFQRRISYSSFNLYFRGEYRHAEEWGYPQAQYQVWCCLQSPLSTHCILRENPALRSCKFPQLPTQKTQNTESRKTEDRHHGIVVSCAFHPHSSCLYCFMTSLWSFYSYHFCDASLIRIFSYNDFIFYPTKIRVLIGLDFMHIHTYHK